jgi:hypothetical protein
VIHGLEWWQLCLPLVLGASLLEPKSAARAGLAGSVPALLGTAALTIFPVGDSGYVAVSIGLIVAGGALPLLAGARALRGPAPASRHAIPGALLMAAGSLALAVRAAPTVAATGLVPVLSLAAGATAGWWTLLMAGRVIRLRNGVVWLDRALLARDPPAALGSLAAVPRVGVALLLAGAVLVLGGSHTATVIGGMVVASIGAELVFRRGARRLPVLPLVTLTLIPAYWLLHTIAEPLGLGVATLDQVPLSPAAARLLALPFALVTWAWMGLWPLHGAVRPVLLAPVGAALWIRVAAPAAGEGLLHWQPLVVAVAVAGIWHAAADGRLASVLVALGFAALASLRPQAVAAAGLLFGAALTLKLPRPPGGPSLVAFDVLRRLGFATSAIGALLAFMAGLRAEVVLTVLAAAGLAYGYLAASPLNDL